MTWIRTRQTSSSMGCRWLTLLVFDAPDKLTLKSQKGDEDRLLDVAMVAVAGVVLVLVYVLRELKELRAISLRRASKQERTLYAKNHH